MLWTSTFRRTATIAAITLTGLLAAPRSAAQPTYAIIELENGGGTTSKAYGMNATGQIVGLTLTGSNERHSAHWLNEVFTDLHGTSHLDLLLRFTVGVSEAYEISNADQVVGTARKELICPQGTIIVTTAMFLRPAVLTDLATPFPGDALTDLGTFGSPCSVVNSAATGVSNANHVVGWSDLDPFGTVHGFIVAPSNGVWFQDGNGDPNTADGINDLMVDLGTMDALSTESAATAVNDSGVVVGYTFVQSGFNNQQTGITEAGYHAYRIVPLDQNADGRGDTWFQGVGNVNTLMQDLGTLGGNNSWGRGINNAGQIVGESDTAAGSTHAFLWQNGVISDLGTLGGANSSASRINDNGDIVGWAENTDGQRRAVAWINGQIVDLNQALLVNATPGIDLIEARDTNANGQIVGWGMTRGATKVEKAFQLRIATAAEIAAAQAEVNPDTGTSGTGGTTTTTGTGAGTTGTGTFSGVPLTVTTVEPQQTTGEGDDVAAPPVCFVGAVGMLPFTLLGMCALRIGVRRRRR